MYNLRILHLGNRFPDARVEKCMISDTRRGDTPAVALLESKGLALETSRDFPQYMFKYGGLSQLGFYSKGSIKDLENHIKQFDPDLIHAHDIYNAILADKLGLPYIYNDHEAWSFKIAATVPVASKMTLKYWRRYLGLSVRKRIVPRREDEILKKGITLTVSDALTEYHLSKGAKAFTVNNYPMLTEIENFKVKEKINGSLAYVGTDLSHFSGPFRDTRGFIEFITEENIKLTVIGDRNLESTDLITNHGFVHHSKINELLESIQFGALAFNSHPFHIFADHVKIYNYLHAGMILIAPNSFDIPEVLDIRKYSSFSDIPDLMMEPSKYTPEEISDHARKNFIWERREESIASAVKLAIEQN